MKSFPSFISIGSLLFFVMLTRESLVQQIGNLILFFLPFLPWLFVKCVRRKVLIFNSIVLFFLLKVILPVVFMFVSSEEGFFKMIRMINYWYIDLLEYLFMMSVQSDLIVCLPLVFVVPTVLFFTLIGIEFSLFRLIWKIEL